MIFFFIFIKIKICKMIKNVSFLDPDKSPGLKLKFLSRIYIGNEYLSKQ